MEKGWYVSGVYGISTLCVGSLTLLLSLFRISYGWLLVLSREGNGTPLQHSCLENPMDRGAWWAAVHGVAKSRTRLSNFTFTFHFHALEKEMATHSNVLAWRIPGTGEPGGLPSMGSQSRTRLKRLSSSRSDKESGRAAPRRKRFFSWVSSTLIIRK